MYCSKCGNQIPDGVRFCPSCGAQVEAPAQQNYAFQPVGNMAGYGAPIPTAPAAAGKSRNSRKLIIIIIAAVCAIALLVSGILIYDHVADEKAAAAEREQQRTTVTDHMEYAGISFPLTDCFTIDEEHSTDDIPYLNVSADDESADMLFEVTSYGGSNSFEDQALIDELFPASQGNILAYSELGDSAGLTWRKARLMMFSRSTQGTLSSQGIETVYIGKADDSDVLHVIEFGYDGSNLTELVEAMIMGAEAVETAEEVPVQEAPAEEEVVEAPPASEFYHSTTWNSVTDIVFAYMDTQSYYNNCLAHYEESDGTYYIVVSADPDDIPNEKILGRALIGLVESDFNACGVKCAVVFTNLDYDVCATYNSTDGYQSTDTVEWYDMHAHSYWWDQD